MLIPSLNQLCLALFAFHLPARHAAWKPVVLMADALHLPLLLPLLPFTAAAAAIYCCCCCCRLHQMLVAAIHSCAVKFPEVASSVVHLLMDFLGDPMVRSQERGGGALCQRGRGAGCVYSAPADGLPGGPNGEKLDRKSVV